MTDRTKRKPIPQQFYRTLEAIQFDSYGTCYRPLLLDKRRDRIIKHSIHSTVNRESGICLECRDHLAIDDTETLRSLQESIHTALCRQGNIWAETPLMMPWYHMERHLAYPPAIETQMEPLS